MPQITIDEDTNRRLDLAARVAGISVGDVVRVLVNEGAMNSHACTEDASKTVPVFSTYLGTRVSAEFDVRSRVMRITSGALKDQEYSAPSSAAIAVVKSSNPKRDNPHTNGWRFWKVEATGRPLESEYGGRRL
jgi:hypothetical protein